MFEKTRLCVWDLNLKPPSRGSAAYTNTGGAFL